MEEHHIVALMVIKLLSRWGLMERVEVEYDPETQQYRTWLLDVGDGGVTRVLVNDVADAKILESNAAKYGNGELEGGTDVIVDDTIKHLCSGKKPATKTDVPLTVVEQQTGLFVLDVLKVLPAFNRVLFINHRVYRWDSRSRCLAGCDPMFVAHVEVSGVFEGNQHLLVQITPDNKTLLLEAAAASVRKVQADPMVVRSWLFATKVYPEATLTVKAARMLQ